MRHYLSIIVISFFLFSCSGKTSTNTEKNKQDSISLIDTIKAKRMVENKLSSLDTILNEENVIVLGDTSKPVKEAINYIAIKFKPYLRFSDFYSNSVNSNTKATIRYSSNSTGQENLKQLLQRHIKMKD